MTADTVRRVAQVSLVTIAIVAGAAAAFSHFGGGTAELFGRRLVVTPFQGPVGIRPFLELEGYGDREVNVYLCADARGPVDDCVELGAVRGGRRVRANVIPSAFPSGDEVVPSPYSLRVGPENGEFPVRGRFEIVPFELGPLVRPRTFEGVQPQGLQIGRGSEVARGVECRPPPTLADGRLAVGRTVYDPETGVTIDLQVAGISEAVWSPTGDKVAMLTTDRKEIRLAAPDGTEAVTSVREARGLLSSLSWSPEGDRLAFVAQNDPAVPRLGPGPPTVNVLNATTGELTTAGPGVWVAWAPTADALAVQMSGSVLELGTLEGGRQRIGEGRRPSWSPDGRLLAFVRGDEDSSEGFIALSNGTQASPVTGPGTCALSFAADGGALNVVERREGETRLVHRPID